MFILGLTGPTGSGKSLASRVFADEGYAVINADQTARSAVRKGSLCLAELVKSFGKEILLPDGELDRKALANLAFSDKGKTNLLNSVTHPHIIEEIKSEIDQLSATGAEAIVLDAPALFESGAQKLCSKVVAVIADKNLRYERIRIRDRLTPEEADRRMAAQHPPGYYTQKADYALVNNGDAGEFKKQAAALAAQLKREFATGKTGGG